MKIERESRLRNKRLRKTFCGCVPSLPSELCMVSIEEKIRKAVAHYLRKHRIPAGASILVGFSGGPDSRVLVSALLSLHRSGGLVLAYLDHGIRPREELDPEIEKIRECAATLGIPLDLGRIPPGRIEKEAVKGGYSVEDLARRYRYEFLRDSAARYACAYIALGHNQDDQLETIITRVFQGSGPGGLKGIPERRGCIIRPLMAVSKEDILAYASENSLDYSLDSTNEGNEYLRNRVRQDIVPCIKEIFPGYTKSLGFFAQKMSLTDDFILKETEKMLSWQPCKGGYKIPEGDFLAAHPVLRLRSLYRLFDLSAERYARTRLPYGALKPVLAWKGGQDAIILQWRNYALSSREGFIFWEEHIVFEEKKQYLIVVDNDIDIVADRQSFRVRLCNNESDDWAFNIRAAAPPLIIRSKRDGDRLCIGGGRTELNKLFSLWKVRSEHRRMIPVLEDREGIVAVLGEHLGYKNRYRRAEEKRANEMVYRINIEVLADG